MSPPNPAPLPARRAAAAALAAALAGCGSASSSSVATPRPSPPTPTRTAPATPRPGPDTLVVAVVDRGLGAYLETTVPVAVLRNAATGHAAQGVAVHFAITTPAGRPAASADAHVGVILPGQTLAVAARVALEGAGDRVTVTVTSVAAWLSAEPGPDPGLAGSLRCRTASCSGFADVLATLPAPLRSAAVTATAVCRSAAGAIVGGDTDTFDPPPADGAIDVAVIISSRPAGCRVDAVAGV